MFFGSTLTDGSFLNYFFVLCSLALQAGKAFALRDLTQAVNTLREWMMAQRAHLEPM